MREFEDSEHGDDLAGSDGLHAVGVVGAREGELRMSRSGLKDRAGKRSLGEEEGLMASRVG